MKVSVMPWHVFWDAFEKQDSPPLDRWVQRWVFTDDGVSALVKTPSREGKESKQPVYVVEQAEPESLLNSESI